VEADLDPAVMREYEQVRSSGEQRTTDGQALCQLPLGVAHAWLPAASCRASALIGGLHSLPYTEYTLLPLLSFPSPHRASAMPTATSSAHSLSTSTPTSCATPPSASTTGAARWATSSSRERASFSGKARLDGAIPQPDTALVAGCAAFANSGRLKARHSPQLLPTASLPN